MKGKRHNHRRGEQGQSIVLIALAMFALVGMTGVALDGAMAYWNQRRAQNGADAGAIAGVGQFIQDLKDVDDGLKDACGTSEQAILNAVYQYAANNEVPDENIAQNVDVYYLKEVGVGQWEELLRADNSPWELTGGTNTVPCSDGADPIKVAGLHVVTHFPQNTFLTGLLGVSRTNVEANAYAVWDYEHWCTDFAVFSASEEASPTPLKLSGSVISVTNGGSHSNGDIHITGGGGGIYLEADRPVEYHGEIQTGTESKFTGVAPDGFDNVDPYPLPADLGYEWADFLAGGKVANTVDPSNYFYITGGKGLDNKTLEDNYWDEVNDVPKDGLYVVDGDIKLNDLKRDGWTWRVTFAATGTIQTSGGFDQLPFANGIFVYTESSGGSPKDVKISGSANHWAGLILVPNGDVEVSGSDNSDLAGMILGGSIELTGSSLWINHRPEYCPENPPRILLVQ
jgi:hypothetical protein